MKRHSLGALFSSYIHAKVPVERLTPNWHLHLVKGVLGHIISVQLIYFPDNSVNIRLLWFCEEEELRPRYCLEASKAENGALQGFQPSSLRWRYPHGRRSKGLSDSMDTC